MRNVRATASEYYSQHEALRAAEQLIALLQSEHERGYFQLDDVTLQAREATFVFTGAEYMAFALRGIREALRSTAPGGGEAEGGRAAGGAED